MNCNLYKQSKGISYSIKCLIMRFNKLDIFYSTINSVAKVMASGVYCQFSDFREKFKWLTSVYSFLFLAFDYCRFRVVICLFSSPPQRPMTTDFEGFLSQILSITFQSYLNYWERASISLFNVECETRELHVPYL